jgi:hypothetical protein
MSMTYDDSAEEEEEEDPTKPFVNLNALEIAAVADAKRFLSQAVVQKIITGIWNGDIIFWDRLSVHTEKKPRFYNHNTADPFSRLRVPKYLKAFEVVFFALFLALYYAVLVERNPYRISFIEILLYLWFAAFTYDEISEWTDAGSIFYTADVWNLFDMIMIMIGFIFACMSAFPVSCDVESADRCQESWVSRKTTTISPMSLSTCCLSRHSSWCLAFAPFSA